MKKRRIWWIFIAVGAGIVLVVSIMKKPKKISYNTVKVERGEIISMISATGTVNPVTSVDVGSQVSGIIQEVFVDFNSEVKKGQVIAQIDPTPFRAKLEQADANLTKAKIAVEDAKRTLDRNMELFSKNLIAQSEKDAAQTAYDNAVAQLKQAQASYDLALSDLRNTTITSPISGVVVSRNINAGQTVAASFSAPTLFTIARDLREMQIEANIDEGNIGRVKRGQKAIFTVDAFPEQTFTGEISQVRIAPQIVQRVVTYTVVIKVNNDELLLKPGMTANINIITDHKSDILKVPNAAFRFKPPENIRQQWLQMAQKSENFIQKTNKSGQPNVAQRRIQNITGIKPPEFKQAPVSTLWILSNGKKLRPVRVKTGITDGLFTEVESEDISEGTEVVTGINTAKTVSTRTSLPFGMGPPVRR